MATIELYKDKINSMSNYIEQAKSAVSDFCTDLSALKKKVLGINSSVCDGIISKISTSSQTQEQQIAGLEATQREVNDFIDLTINRDNAAAQEIIKAKKDFYKEYDYLKPDSEKSDWEKFCDKLKDVGEWCKEHWKLVVTVVICIAAIALICTGVGGILGAAALGALIGAGSGGLIGGISSVMAGGSFLEGFEEGAFSGAITGAIMGGIGGAGALFGKTLTCGTKLANFVSTTAKISIGMSTVMGGFDTLAMGLGMIDPDNPITALNSKLHQSKLYNAFQVGVTAVATFTGAASATMACFIAGTMVLTAAGLVAIENIRAGDVVISTNPDTLDTAEKTVLETYVRQVDKLVHLTINGEKIVTTIDHPFYVQNRGFINAGNLLTGDTLISVNGEDLLVPSCYIEEREHTTVYNFQVEDYHTYFVGECGVWVHNRTCTSQEIQDIKDHLEGNKSTDGAKPDGRINGCHEESRFLSELDVAGGDLTNNIQNVNGVDGVTYVEYTANTRTGKAAKTIYDSNIISTDDYINRGLEAYANVPESVNGINPTTGQSSGVSVTALDNSGKEWNFYIRDNKLITMYPSI